MKWASWNSNHQKHMAKCNFYTKFELTWLFGFCMLLCHSVCAGGKVIICNWSFGHGKPSESRVSCEDRPIQGYRTRWPQRVHSLPSRLLSARYFPAFFGPFGPPMNHVASPWKPTFGCGKTPSVVLQTTFQRNKRRKMALGKLCFLK